MTTSNQFFQLLLSGGAGVGVSWFIDYLSRHNKRFNRFWHKQSYGDKRVFVAIGSIMITIGFWYIMLLVGTIPTPATDALAFEAFLDVLKQAFATFTTATITHGYKEQKSPAKKRRAKRVIRRTTPETVSEQTY